MSSLIFEPNASKAFFMKHLPGYLLRRDAAKMIDRVGSIFLLHLATKTCEVCDEKRAKKVAPENVYEALIELGCNDYVPTLQDILAVGELIEEESEEEQEKIVKKRSEKAEYEPAPSKKKMSKLPEMEDDEQEEICMKCKKNTKKCKCSYK